MARALGSPKNDGRAIRSRRALAVVIDFVSNSVCSSSLLAPICEAAQCYYSSHALHWEQLQCNQ